MVATALLGLAMLVGLVGVLLPALPGTLLILGAGAMWAVLVAERGPGRWVVVGAMAMIFVLGIVAKYALPGRRLSGQLPRSTLLFGGVGAAVGFILLPPLGLLIGGVLGIYLAEARRVGPGQPARHSTVQALKAVGLGVLAELTAALLMIATWLTGLVLT
jgi:uncharacterized protein YqgC (DUF456 family)